MPHKHKRKRDGDDKHFDLPPSKVAKPLSNYEKPEKKHHKGPKPKAQPQKRRRDATSDYKEDDTPRAFARLMQLQSGQRQRSGLDNGEAKKAKKRQRAAEKVVSDAVAATNSPAAAHPDNGEKLKIMPGERLADFAARVNQALPVGGLARKREHDDGGPKERRTKTEKRLHKMYAEWRVEDAKRKEKEEEFQEQQEEKDEELQAELGGQDIYLKDEGKKAKRKRMLTEAADGDDDPWAVLKTRREAPKGLNDVVQAPPEMKVVPKEKFKVRNGAKIDVANVPSASGSLKRREELGEARKEVIERYRSMMKGKGGL